MISTTASSSSVLLNPVAQTGNSTVTSDAAPDAALSRFQLLLGAVQQLSISTDGSDASAAVPQNPDEISSDASGNVLPLLGMILPQAAPDETGKADTDAAKSKAKKDEDTDSVVTASIATDVVPLIAVIPPAGFVLQPRSDSGTATTAAVQNDTALAVQSDVIDSAASRANNTAVASMPKGGTNALGTGALNATPGADVSMTAANAATFGKEVQDASKNLVESDFDVLVKHFDTPNPTSLSAVGLGDSAGASQASRTYLNAASTATTAAVQVPVGSDGWSDAVADKVMWFSANKISSAEIHLNPPDLGPLQVRVSTQHDQMSVVFTSQHAAVRDALDQALPRLRDMMGSQGMHSLDVSVGGQSAQQQQQQQSNRNDSAGRGVSFGGFFADGSADATVNVTTVNTARLLRSGVDAYA